MALTRTQIDAIVTKIQGTRDLSSGGILALKEVLNGINLGDAPEDGTTYGREDGAWVTIPAGGGGNSVTVTVDFGATPATKAELVVTGQAWVTATSEIVCQIQPNAASKKNPDDLYLYKFVTSISDLVVGVGFTVTLYTDAKASGEVTVMCIGV